MAVDGERARRIRVRLAAALGARIELPRWRLLTGVLAAFLAGALLVAVAPYLGSRLGGSEPPEEDPLVVIMDQDQSVGQQRVKLIAEWNETYEENSLRGQEPRWPPAPIELKQLPRSATAARSQLVAYLQSGAEADVLSLDVIWTGEFADADLIRPLDEDRLDTDAFLERPLETGIHNGELWALPWYTDAGLLFYHRELVTREPTTGSEGVPDAGTVRTWMREQVAQPQVGGAPLYAGQFADYEGFTVNALEAMWGWDAANDGEPPLITRDGEVADSAILNAWLDSDWLLGPAPGGSPPVDLGDVVGTTAEALSFQEGESLTRFRTGQTMFMRNWPFAYRTLADPGGEAEAANEPDRPEPTGQPEAVEEADLWFGVTRLPGPSVLGGQNLAIAASTDQPEAALELIRYLTDAGSQRRLFRESGFPPTRTALYHDDTLREEFPYLDELLVSVLEARIRPVTVFYEQWSALFRRYLRPAMIRSLRGGDAAVPVDFPEWVSAALDGRRPARE